MVTMFKTVGVQYPLTLKSTVLLEITLSKCLASDQIGRVLRLSITIDPEVELGVPSSRTGPCFSFSILNANRYGEPEAVWWRRQKPRWKTSLGIAIWKLDTHQSRPPIWIYCEKETNWAFMDLFIIAVTGKTVGISSLKLLWKRLKKFRVSSLSS